MKKLMFTLALSALIAVGAQAQEKQKGDEHNIEVNFTPFSGSPIDGSTIKYRKFSDGERAIRVSLSVASSTDTYAWYQDGEMSEADPVSPQLDIISSTTEFTLAPGYEKHFSGEDKLSPYIAVELPFTRGNRMDSQEYWGPEDIDDVAQPDRYVPWNVQNEQGYQRIGLNVLFGADYYFYDDIYVGFEAGLGFGSTKVLNHKITTDNLTAFNILFNNAFTSEAAGAAVAGEFAGLLPFSAVDGVLYNEYWNDDTGATYPYPNLKESSSFGNAFQGALRVGFLFE